VHDPRGDPSRRGIEKDLATFRKRRGIHVAQPIFADSDGEGKGDFDLAAPPLDLIHLDGDQEIAVAQCAFRRETAFPSARERVAERAGIDPSREVVGEAGEEAAGLRLFVCGALRRVESGGFGEAEEGLENGADLARRAGVDAEAAAAFDVEASLFGIAPSAREDREVRVRLGAEGVFGLRDPRAR